MKKYLLPGLIAVIVLAVIVVVSYSTPKRIEFLGQYPEKTKKELIGDANVIIRGAVSKIYPGKWSNPGFKRGEGIGNIIQTDIQIQIEEVFKGEPYNKKNVIVRIEEGRVGNTVAESNGYPDFKKGEEAILFLSKDDSDVANPQENYYVLTGAYYGKFAIRSEKVDDKLFVMAHDKDSIRLSTFKKEVEDELEYLKNNPKSKMSKEEIRQQNEKVFGK
mgnify:CR=1 FL=1